MTVIAVFIAVIVGFAYFVAWAFVWWLAIDKGRPIAAIVLAVVLVALLLLGVDRIAEDPDNPDNSVHCGGWYDRPTANPAVTTGYAKLTRRKA